MNQPSLDIKTGINVAFERQMYTAVVTSATLAVLIAAALRHQINIESLGYWLLAILAVSGLRLFNVHQHWRTHCHNRLQLPLTLASGLIWGSSVPLFLPALDAGHQSVLMLALLGLVAGSSNAYAGRMQLFYAFMFPCLMPLAAWLFMQQTDTYSTLGIAVLLYTVGLSVIARRNTLLLLTTADKNEQLTTEINLRKAYEQRLELQQRILDAIARHHGALPDILTTIVQQVETQRPGMIASILLLDDEGKHMHNGAAPNLPVAWNATTEGSEIGPVAGSCGTAAFRNERVIVADIANDPLWENYAEAALSFGLKACWSEPIHHADGHVLGTFAMYYHDIRHPSNEDLQLIEYVASLTSTAIDNCRNREQLEIARQQHAELLDTVNHSSDMVYVYGLDGIITAANDAANTLFGEQLIGKNIAEIIAPDQLQLALDMIQKKLKTGESTVYELDVIDLHDQRHHLEINSSLISRRGKPVAINGIARDITKRKQAEKQLALLIQAINASHEAIMVLDDTGIIEFANPAAADMYQTPSSQIIGKQTATLRGGSTDDDIYNSIISTIRHGKIWSGEILFHVRDNDERLVARRISPIMDESGHVHHQICIDRDITEARQRSQLLEHTQRLESLGILAGGIAHDFNNMLTAIMGNAAMAERSMDTGGNIKTFLSNISESSQRAADLCKQMLAYSGKGHFVIKTINLSDLIREMTRLMEVSIHKQISVRYGLNEDLPLVDADPAQIQQVILNLITNANEAIGDQPGEIAFTTGVIHAKRRFLATTRTGEHLPSGEYVYIEVADNGCGMDKTTMDKMFDPFFTTKFTGRGLGMSAMLGIVRGHHGGIFVNSQTNIGTTFKVLLPASKIPKQTEIAADSGKTISRHTGVILVVDDEEPIREVATIMLQDMGLDSICACNGEEAIQIYRKRQNEISAVLLDMTMPKMDGKTCFKALLEINPDVQVMISSGYTEQDINTRFSGQTPAGFLQKPYTHQLLQQKMEEILR